MFRTTTITASATRWFIGGCAAMVIFGILAVITMTRAAIAPSPCDGNVCTGSMVIGGQTVTYAYTHHLSQNGTFKIRLNGGTYTTGMMISFVVSDMPAFSSWDKYANPANGAVFLPEEQVNPGRTAYERRDSNGCASCIVDQVMSVTYTALAPGQYSFDLSVIQNGAAGGLTNLPFYVDAAAPDNRDESDAWVSIVGMDLPCADAFDNDISYRADCGDVRCVGEIGRVGDGALCEAAENTCYDGFDNDSDGSVDCQDPDCDGKVGDTFSGALCRFGNEFGAAACGDAFDNDGDGRTDCLDNVSSPSGNPANTCWKQAAYGCAAVELSCTDSVDNDKDVSYGSTYDAAPLTGRDCADYDCAGNSACPASENATSSDTGSLVADAQCFDGLDNDLDALIDCGDSDCLGVTNPSNPSQACLTQEFDLAAGYQFCGNVLDDDGDTAADCADPECSRQFGNCGPCPSREDLTFDSCADVRDNDTDGAMNCADADCSGDLGALTNAAQCLAAESGSDACFDGFDNDGDGNADCADAGCAGATSNGKYVPLGYSCQTTEGSAAICSNGFDDDMDGAIDCRDSGCWGLADCAPKNWTNAACQIVPSSSALTAFTGNLPTVLASVTEKVHAGDDHVIRITGSGNYSSLTIVVGDNTDAAAYYPWASSSTCALTGTGSSSMGLVAVNGRAMQIYDLGGATINGFDVFLSCTTPATPAAAVIYPVSLSALRQPGDIAEYGDLSFSTELYETTAPTVTEVEAGGAAAGTVDVEWGGDVGFRMAVNEPGSGLDHSGVCGCSLFLDADETLTADGDCTVDLSPFYQDRTYSVRGSAVDGANNSGPQSAAQSLAVNVTPRLITDLTLGPSKPFFDSARPEYAVFAEYKTSTLGWFTSCDVYIRDSASHNVVNGPVGPTDSFPGFPIGNQITCDGALTMPAMTDGEYYVSIRAIDEDGDYVESNRNVAYMCNDVPGPGEPETACSHADFDRDGATEGLFTTLYGAAMACDNCVGLSNSSQGDANANGVGDVCEPTEPYGRCEYDRDLVCLYDSDDPACPDDLCCPGPSINPPNADPQACRDPFGLCSLSGEVCFEDSECVTLGIDGNGNGTCDLDGGTFCKRDADCDGGATGPCVGANVCDNLVFPWLQTFNGNIFSTQRILAEDAPPAGMFNATYCIGAKDSVRNFTSELCGTEPNSQASFDLPGSDNAYSSVLGRIDVPGLKNGRYGTVTSVSSGQLDAQLGTMNNPLGGRVIVVEDGGDAYVSAKSFWNGSGTNKGNGTVLIDGGDLYITGNMNYGGAAIDALDQLASLGWIVLPDEDGNKGNVYVTASVETVVGNFYVGGDGGFHTVAPPAVESDVPLTLEGLVIARRFALDRSLESLDRGSEQFVYDGRAVANPPPGFGDVGRSLPSFVSGQ